jgi:hypothetical protein
MYENYIKAAVSAVSGVTAVRKWVFRKQRRNVWDVDVGFVYREILFLIEAKIRQRTNRRMSGTILTLFRWRIGSQNARNFCKGSIRTWQTIKRV